MKLLCPRVVMPMGYSTVNADCEAVNKVNTRQSVSSTTFATDGYSTGLDQFDDGAEVDPAVFTWEQISAKPENKSLQRCVK